MTDPRPPIPAALERDLMIEAGYRCAICKATEPLDIDHIVEWSIVRKHEFHNMIVLCKNCHGRKKKTSDPRDINRISLRRIKENLMLLNARYSDLERRIIEKFQDDLATNQIHVPSIILPERLQILVRYLIKDGLVFTELFKSSISQGSGGMVFRDDNIRLTLTRKGRRFIKNLNSQAS
jgi:HNH endonuclease